ncbi:MAG: adenylate/guanylate cyclase domain-containing protein [Chloroflexota bacterium]
MSELPTGTITFLFSDIEGSTRLAQALDAAWPPLLERHQEIARAVWSAHGGTEVGTDGDSFFVVFSMASQAVAAAADVQRALASEPWPAGSEIRVRIGLHTGAGLLSGGTYVGLDVHRAARVSAAGNGGQVLLTEATHALLGGSFPPDTSLKDHGEHKLKDLSRAERIWELSIGGLRTDLPPLRTLNAIPNNLPTQLTSFLGRQRELAEAQRLLTEGRLLTLTGPGGTGKTRLSLQIAADSTDRFPDGVYYVPLGQIAMSELVIPTIAQAVGVVDPGSRPLDRLVEQIGEKCVLLVLDNFEQVIDAAAQVNELLARAPKTSVLITSRSPLRVYGEREYPVPPLGVPDPKHLPSLAGLSQFESVALFIERAMAVRPDFAVNSGNAPAVAEICARLDGLPLAIELAAARIRLLSPQAIMDRLGDRMGLLSSGSRDLPQRQQTLRGAIAWSHDLLDEVDRRVFARISVFAGGATLDAAQMVLFDAGEPGDALDAIGSLVDKSLIRQETQADGEPRFRMLETIREFALEQLVARGEEEALRERHAACVLGFAERAGAEVFGSDQATWLDRFEAEHDNIRAAMSWALARDRAATAMPLLVACWRFWQMRGYLQEARERANQVLELPSAAEHPDARAAALEAAGGIAYWQADLEAARRWYQEGLDLARASGDDRRIANALYNLSFAFALTREDQAGARGAAKEVLEIARRLGDDALAARSLWALANTIYFFGETEGMMEATDEALAIFRRLGEQYMVGWTLYSVALGTMTTDPARAHAAMAEGLDIFRAANDVSAYGLMFDVWASLYWNLKDPHRAMILAGFAEAIERRAGGGLAAINRSLLGFDTVELLKDPALAAAYAEGSRMDVEQAAEVALTGAQS